MNQTDQVEALCGQGHTFSCAMGILNGGECGCGRPVKNISRTEKEPVHDSDGVPEE